MMLKLIWWIGFILLGIAGVLLAKFRRNIIRYWLTAAGTWLTTGAFFALSWIEFAPWCYAQNLTLDTASETLITILEWSDLFKRLPKILTLIPEFVSLSGLRALVFLPSLNIWIRLTLFAVPVMGILGVIGVLVGRVLTDLKVKRYIGLSQAGFALLTLILLITNLNTLDGWATAGQFPHNLLPVLTGAKIGLGPWIACVGLLFVVIAGFLNTVNTSPKTDEHRYDWEDL
jgi:hypothetical protein